MRSGYRPALTRTARKRAKAGHDTARFRVPKMSLPTRLTAASPTGAARARATIRSQPAVAGPPEPDRRSPAPADRDGHNASATPAPMSDQAERAGHGSQPHELVRIADRPVLEADSDVVRGEWRQRSENLGRRRVQVGDQPGEPREEPDRRRQVGDQRRPSRPPDGPTAPTRAGREDEDSRVVAVHRAARAGGVEHPPASPARRRRRAASPASTGASARSSSRSRAPRSSNRS